MRTLWTAISVIAVANLMAIVLLGGWLYSSERLSIDRLRSVVDVMDEPIAAEAARLDREASEAGADAASQAGLASLGPPLSSSEAVALKIESSEMDEQRIRRLRREIDDLRRTLRLERSVLDEERESFETERAEFFALRERLRDIEGAEQFQKALVVLSQMKAADAKTTLATLLADDQREEVISYLNGLEDRKRTAVFTQFVKDGEQVVAADLLEAIRTRGLDAPANGDAPVATANDF